MTGSHSSRPPAHECDDPAYPAAAMPDECTCGSGAAGDRTLPEEAAMARRRLRLTSGEAD